MRLLLRRVPQLQRLTVFEAVGRLGTFTATASELGMSQPAVSRQMAALEDTMQAALFDRRSNHRTLLHFDQTGRTWQNWSTWFASNCLRYAAPADRVDYPTYGAVVWRSVETG